MIQEEQEQFFIDNKYLVIYLKIIEDSKNRPRPEKYEKHHIIPKSFGGSDSEDNYAYLTLREHFLVHLILVKIAKGQYYKHKMAHALNRMTNSKKGKYKITSRMYETARIEHSEAMSDKNNPSYTDGRAVGFRKDPKIRAIYYKENYANARDGIRVKRANMTPEERKKQDKKNNDKRRASMTPEELKAFDKENNAKRRAKKKALLEGVGTLEPLLT